MIVVASLATACGSEAVDDRDGSSGEIDRTSSYLVEQWSTDAWVATDMAFLPDGRALVTTKGGWGGASDAKVVLVASDGTSSTSVLTIPVCSDAERGVAEPA